MFADSHLGGCTSTKRNRGDYETLWGSQSRAQVRFVEELVESYFLRPSRIESEQAKRKGLGSCNLDEVSPSLAKQVGAVVHRYQLLNSKYVPSSFAHSNVPLQAPKRPFIAAVLAIVARACVFENSGVHISVTAFDRWFEANSCGRFLISKVWLDAKMYVARCVARRDRIALFGQEVIGYQFIHSGRLRSLDERIFWMIHVSIGCGDLSLHDHAVVEHFKWQNIPETDSWFRISKESHIWSIWSTTVFSLDIFSDTSAEDKTKTSEALLGEGVKRGIQLVALVIGFLRSERIDKCDHSYRTMQVLFSGTAGELAAVSVFLGMKRAVKIYFSGKPFNKKYILKSTEIMSRLFQQLVLYYTFLVPTNRHYCLLDACEALWQNSRGRGLQEVSKESAVSVRRENSFNVFQEDVFVGCLEGACIYRPFRDHTLTPPMSRCNLNIIGSSSGLELFLRSIELQRGINSESTSQCCENVYKRNLLVEVFSTRTVDTSIEDINLCTSWCLLNLPPDTEDETHFVNQFVRDTPDSVSKKLVIDTVVALTEEDVA
ncbi:hypothetical protein, conserved [Trypanosoma brucei brucei TREU927]|uniref:Uncharacterized protein n=1 Tax=Trypanosoma brucei brucei (strain 927/4 GUTat10.1) TaxID=185431 RepID=Q384L9_TRYB2|nr:hypothetical protein, conserved [Trypanosoma brucei brucei TREU927]EAN79762.1 hypothetical protein, conserved [Trypanosoma brucei brucei TREU927]